MLRFLPLWVELFLLVFCLIDAIQSDEGSIRNLGKTWWILLILFFPIVGGVAWLVAGRPISTSRNSAVSWPSTRTAGFPEHERPRSLAPDDDPAFLASMRRSTDEKEDLLRTWEDDLRRREQELRGPTDGTDGDRRPDPPAPPTPPTPPTLP